MVRTLVARSVQVAMLLVSAYGNLALAESPAKVIEIYLHNVDGRVTTPVETVSLADKFFYIAVTPDIAISGLHRISTILYDPSGQKAFRATREDYYRAKDRYAVGYFFRTNDVPGKWRVVAMLDGVPIADQWLVIKPFPKE